MRRDGERQPWRSTETLRLAPGSADVHLHLGIAYGERDDLARAIAHLETAARLAPSDPVVRKNLSHAYALRDSTPPPSPPVPDNPSKGGQARPGR
jgi:predicted Zn-dependent protease